MKLKFLGTGGGRYVTGEQIRNTGGIVVKTEETQVHIDPGPGALVHAHEELDEPLETEALIVSHAHLDHANDAEAILEMMTEAAENPGTVFANETVLDGHGEIDKALSTYHQKLAARMEKLEEGTEHEFQDLTIKSQEMFHSDPHTQGFTLETEEKKIGFWTDTEFSEELLPLYEDCDIMVVYCTRPREKSIPSHTSVDDVPEIMESVEAETVILTHFGYSMLVNEGIEKQKEWLEEELDEKVVFAEDGMQFPGNRTIEDF